MIYDRNEQRNDKECVRSGWVLSHGDLSVVTNRQRKVMSQESSVGMSVLDFYEGTKWLEKQKLCEKLLP